MILSQKNIWDHQICKELLQIIKTRNFAHVHCYLPMESEVDITPLIAQLLANDISVITPKTLPERKLEHRILISLSNVEKGVFGTSHPANSEIYSGNFDLIIVPGLAFSKEYYRLGYGGGYYDTFLSKNAKAYKLGICYPFQIVDELPIEEHDQQLDGVLYPNKI